MPTATADSDAPRGPSRPSSIWSAVVSSVVLNRKNVLRGSERPSLRDRSAVVIRGDVRIERKSISGREKKTYKRSPGDVEDVVRPLVEHRSAPKTYTTQYAGLT
jgi:hypothetical protein